MWGHYYTMLLFSANLFKPSSSSYVWFFPYLSFAFPLLFQATLIYSTTNKSKPLESIWTTSEDSISIHAFEKISYPTAMPPYSLSLTSFWPDLAVYTAVELNMTGWYWR